ncbi:MAG: BON domain-containing protein [Burkholderiales bacterium]|jgi:osmotically-inducible protein OsmY
MTTDCSKSSYRVLRAFAAAALALSLAACGDKPPAESASAKIESASDAAALQAKAAAAAAAKKQAEEQQAQADAAKKIADEKAATDQALADKVKAALVATPSLKRLGVDVRASDGAVTLFGAADSKAQRRKAELVASKVPGVRSVKDELQIARGS